MNKKTNKRMNKRTNKKTNKKTKMNKRTNKRTKTYNSYHQHQYSNKRMNAGLAPYSASESASESASAMIKNVFTETMQTMLKSISSELKKINGDETLQKELSDAIEEYNKFLKNNSKQINQLLIQSSQILLESMTKIITKIITMINTTLAAIPPVALILDLITLLNIFTTALIATEKYFKLDVRFLPLIREFIEKTNKIINILKNTINNNKYQSYNLLK
jgi:hypothetical protein